MKAYNPGFPFTFNFLDEAYQKQYDTETRVSQSCQNILRAWQLLFPVLVYLVWPHLLHKKEEKKSALEKCWAHL